MFGDMKGGGWEGGGDSDAIDRGLLEFLKDNGKHGVVIDGVVSWIEVQMEVGAENIWKAQAEAKYSDEEVMDGKKALWDAAQKNIGETQPRRQGKSKRWSDIDDIHKALMKLKCANALPLILASSRMVARGPVSHGIPVDANNDDVVSRISALEDSMTSFMRQQNDQIKNLTNTVGLLGMPKRTHVTKVTTSNDLESPGKRKRMEEKDDKSGPATSFHPAGTVSEESTSFQSFPPLRSTGTGFQPSANIQKAAPKSYAGAATLQPSGMTGIQQIQPQDAQTRRRPSIMFGTAKTGKDDNESLLAADVSLVASGVSKDASPDQLKDFIESKGISVINIEKLTHHPEARTNTFKVVIKLSDYEKAMNPEVWPYRVGVRHYKPLRRNQGMSWNDQAKQAGGGNVGNQGNNQQQNQQHRQPRYHQNKNRPSPFNLDLQNRYQALDGQSGEVFTFN